MTYTKSPTDLAVSGNGFFMVQSSAGTPYLTRAGSFVPNSEGELVNAAGFKLLGYSLLGGDLSSIINSPAGLEVVGSANLGMKAVPSTTGAFQVNLPAGAAVTATADLPGANAATSEYAGKTSLVTYDNLGNEVVLDIYSAKTAANTWQVAVYDHSKSSASGGFPYTGGALTTSTLTFDGTTGQLASTSPSSLSVTVPNGAALTLNLTNTTQLAGDYTPQKATANGNAPAAVDRLEISKGGIVTAIYADGSRVDAYKIPLANVASPDNLTAISGNVFATSKSSGDLQLGTANTGSLGQVVSGALEKSTVDLASELTEMVEAQRSYTANSKVFQTGAQLLDVLVNLVR
jgi:flagellar hook protein FlgE